MNSSYYEMYGFTNQMITASPSFKFIVGPEKEEFYLHANVVSAQSDVLNKLVNGEMKEAKERCAEWPDVKVETFACFAMFAYTSDYISVYDEPEEAELEKCRDKTSQSQVIDDEFYSPYHHSNKKKRSQHIPNTKFFTDCPDIICKHDLSGWPTGVPVGSNTLTVHARMYVFGDYHGIDELSKLALRKLHRMLMFFTVTEDTLITLGCLVRYCYKNTRATKDESLRVMVSTYCAKAFMSHKKAAEVDSLMRTVPEFAADVFQKIQA